MTRASDLKQGVRFAKKLKFKKSFTISEFKVAKKRGLIKGKPGEISLTKKGSDFVKTIERFGFI